MKVGIVGAGFVGSAAGYAMVLRHSCRELLLIDVNHAKAEAEADDIQHATPVSHPVLVSAGSYEELRGRMSLSLLPGSINAPVKLDLISSEGMSQFFRALFPVSSKRSQTR